MRCENPKYQTLPPKSKHRRQHSDEKPSSSRSFKRPKTSEFRLESSLQERASSLGSGSYFTLPHHRKSQKVTKASSFNVPSAVPAPTPSVKRENSLTSKLQDQSMGIHRLIFDRLNNNDHPENVKCECSGSAGSLSKAATAGKSRRFLALEEQRKLVKFRRFLRAAHICTKSDFLSAIEAIRRRQKREARRSIVDEHGIPPLYTQSR